MAQKGFNLAQAWRDCPWLLGTAYQTGFHENDRDGGGREAHPDLQDRDAGKRLAWAGNALADHCARSTLEGLRKQRQDFGTAADLG
eukprot:4666938-Amphidinium_carterae.2